MPGRVPPTRKDCAMSRSSCQESAGIYPRQRLNKKSDFENELAAAENYDKQLVIVDSTGGVKQPRLRFDFTDLNKIFLILDEYEKWLNEGDDNLFQIEFCQKNRERFGITLYWFISLEEHMATEFWTPEDTKTIKDFYKKMEKVRSQKTIRQAVRRKSDVASSIFYLKAHFGWRDGNEKSAAVNNTYNVLNLENMSLKELEHKINKLMDKDEDETEEQKIEAKFKELN